MPEGEATPPPLPLRTTSVRGCGRHLGLTDERGLDLELDLVPDQQASRLQDLVPGESPVPAVQLAAGRNADPVVAPGVGEALLDLCLQCYGPRLALDRELAADPVSVPAYTLHFRARVGHLREALDVEEVGRTEMLVPLLNTGVEADGLDGDVDHCRGRVVVLSLDFPGVLLEAAADRRDHHVFTREPEARVGWVDAVDL